MALHLSISLIGQHLLRNSFGKNQENVSSIEEIVSIERVPILVKCATGPFIQSQIKLFITPRQRQGTYNRGEIGKLNDDLPEGEV